MNAESKKGTPMLLDIAALDGTGLQSRVALNAEVVEEYAEIFREHKFVQEAMAPVRVVYGAAVDKYYLTDGFHRVEAAKKAGHTKICALVTTGTYTDALREAIGANATNGLRRTNEDKRHALEMAWENRQELFGGEPSNGVLADACGISQRTVIRFRESFTCDKVTGEPDEAPPVRIGRDGRKMRVPDGKSEPKANIRLLDRVGQVVPEHLRWAFTDRETPRMLKGLKSYITECDALRRRNPLANLVISSGELQELELWYNHHRFELPYAVCGYCGGSGKNSERPEGMCPWCHGHGFLGRLMYQRLPSEFKVSPTSTTSTNTEESNKDKE